MVRKTKAQLELERQEEIRLFIERWPQELQRLIAESKKYSEVKIEVRPGTEKTGLIFDFYFTYYNPNVTNLHTVWQHLSIENSYQSFLDEYSEIETELRRLESLYTQRKKKEELEANLTKMFKQFITESIDGGLLKRQDLPTAKKVFTSILEKL